MRQIWKFSLILLCMLLLSTGLVLGQQDEVCPTIVQSAMTGIDEICSDTARNQACYGNLSLEMVPKPTAQNISFQQPGDIANLADIQSMVLSTMNTTENTWGVALLKIQANLPDTLPGQNVTMLLFGDVEIQNAVDTTEEPPTIEMTSTGGINVRGAPSTNVGVVASLSNGETVIADGRNTDGTWVRIQLSDGNEGWVFSELLTTSGNINDLKIVVAGEAGEQLGPMQAFYFTTGIGDAQCNEAPDSGILIQTPAGGQRVSLRANGVDITLGSTAYLQASPDDEIVMAVVEGMGTMSAEGETVTVPAGTQVSVPLDENGQAAGTPSEPEPYNIDEFSTLPIQGLPEEIVIAAPLSPDEINAVIDSEPVFVAPENFVAPNVDMSALGFMGFSPQCIDLFQRVANASNAMDIGALTALEGELESSGCLAEAEAIAAQYESSGSDFGDDGSGE